MEKTRELAVVSGDVNLLNFSGRLVRIKFQTVISALLLASVAQYGISEFSFFNAVKLEKQPSLEMVFIGLWLFSIFNLYSFLQQYKYEKSLIPNTLIVLDVIMNNLHKSMSNSVESFKNVSNLVDEYNAVSRSDPPTPFNQKMANSFSSKIFEANKDCYPDLVSLRQQLSDIYDDTKRGHFPGGRSRFAILVEELSKLVEALEKFHQLAISLSDRNKDKTHILEKWPINESNGIIINHYRSAVVDSIEPMKKSIRARKKLEKSIGFELAFNIPFWLSIGLFVFASLEFIQNHWCAIMKVFV